MKAPSIVIPGGRPRSVEEFFDRAQGNRRAAPAQKPKARFLSHDGRELKRPGIQGFACLYDTTFQSHRGLVFLQQGCLWDSTYDGTTKRMLLNHDDNKQVGSSANGLEFADTSKHCRVNGLAFRMRLDDDNPDAELIYDTVTRQERPCVSVGLSFQDYETVTIKGHKVEVVSKAKIEEISLVREGAVPGTNATIVDLANEEPWLFMAARSDSFVGDKLVSNVQAAAQRIVDRLEILKREL